MKRYPSLSQRPLFGKYASGQQLTIKTWHSLNQDFFHFNMQQELSHDSKGRLLLAWLCEGRVGLWVGAGARGRVG